MQNSKNKKILWSLVLLIVAVTALTCIYVVNKRKLLIAPMIGPLDSCIFKKADLVHDTPNYTYTKLCQKDKESPSQLIEATLQKISKRNFYFDTGDFALGYTLYVPLLKLFEIKGPSFEINQESLKRVVKSIENVDRPVILYLFSDHFGVGSPVEDRLSSDPENLLQTVRGVMSKDRYYSVNIYPWSFVNTENEVTRLREKAVHAVMDEICKLPWYVRNRIEGVTILGELHHMFPDFQAGMGYTGEYLISDYSQRSVADFRKFLAARFKSVNALNQLLGSDFANFSDISPPSKNIRTDPLKNYWEHIDAFAHGTLPITGWVGGNNANPGEKDWIQLYHNGSFLARVPVAFGRQDVVAVHKALPSSNVGWIYNFDYTKVSPGLHKIDIYLERGHDRLTHLASRQIAIMDKSQTTPTPATLATMPQAKEADTSILFHVDGPPDLSSYYFNPLVVLWHQFRKQQVSEYLAHFGTIARNKCINPKLIYSHQILPFVNPSWDENKFGVGRDLAVPQTMRLGVSLYGESSYGTSFFDWFKGTHRTHYGVTEFHPLRAMKSAELESVLRQHYSNNAQFVSFFAEVAGLNEYPGHKPYLFSFDPNNTETGSDVLYESVKDILK